MRPRLLVPTLLAAALAAAPALAQAPAGLPLQPARTLSLDVHGGSWLSLDVSPDGRTVLFDMLGDLYAMPVAGGQATQITRGLAFDTQAVFSPDGRWIAFVSDRSGAENLWIARPDGTGARQVTDNRDDTVFVSPEWSADGQALFASRFRPDLNNYELWRFGLDGARTLITPVKPTDKAPRSAWRSTLGAAASPDGRFLYVARRVGGVNFDELDAWTIVRRELATGAETPVIEGSGGRGADHETFFRPRVSPDGRFLAYVTRTEHRDELRLRDLQTGADRLLAAPLDPDQLQSSAWQDLAARYAFTPDGRAILLSRANKIERIEVADGRVTPAPFEAHMQVDVGPSTRRHIREETGPVRARLAQHAITSPDGKRIAFSALGDVYVQPLKGGPARRLGPGSQPSWSPDGRRLVYVTWTEAEAGAVWTIAADGSGAPVRVSDIAAFYTYPVYTPDGTQVLAVRSPAAARQHTSFEFGKRRAGQFVAFPSAGGPARVVAEGSFGGRPQFVANDPGAVFVGAADGLDRLDLSTGARRLVAQVKGPGYYFVEGDVPVDDLQISPDGRWLLAQVAQQVYLLPTPAKAATLDVTDAGAARRLTDVGADFLRWAPDGGIDLVTGSRFQRLPPPAAVASEPEGAVKPRLTVQLTAEVPRDRPAGDLLIRHVRALTMANGDKVIPDADILVHDDRFAAIGPSGSLAAPKGATVLDLTGKTVLPGFIDEHDHIGEVRRDVLSLDDWGLKARLAYGVTTSFDPSTLSIDMLAYQDLLDAGRMVGPRLRSTGPAVFSMNRFTSLDEVRAVLRRYRDDYRLSNIKEYRTGNRRVRQWMAIALKELGLQPTTEGALALKLDVSQMLDGFAGHEHALPAEPLGPDIVGLMSAMRTSYSTTLMVTNSGPPGADWFVAADDAEANPKMRRFWPPWAIAQKLDNRPWRPLADYRFSAVAPGVQALADAGGLVGMGAHGEVPGIGFHWEMEAHVMGGAKPMTVLHAATAGSAETIGRLDDLGTLEPGKLADLVILDRNPLADIRNTQAIHAVMRGGRLYDGETLDELWPIARPLPKSRFESLDRSAAWLPAPSR